MSINHIELRHLRYFKCVAEERSFTRAAAKLHISQPPLSRQIRILEEALNVQLFRRTKRKVVLTDAGNNFLKTVQKILKNVSDSALEIQGVARGEVGELRIGLLFSASLYPRFAKLVREFRLRYPNVRLIFKEVPYDQGLRLLYNNDVDICFQRPFEVPKDGKIQYQIFSDDHMHLCLSKHHPLARKKTIGIEDLKDELFMINPDQLRSPLYEHLEKLAHKAGFFLQVYKDTATFPVLANLVAAEYGVAFLPTAMGDAAHGEVVFKDITGIKRELCHQPLRVCYRSGDPNLSLKNFLAMAKIKK
ncbi:MAG: LysR family transcriptional regulator [Alphaproteobacteria bacterium]